WERAPAAMVADLARHLSIVDEVCERWAVWRAPAHGAGDSTVSACARASDALAAAVDLQQAMRTEVWAGPEPLRARVAVHAGEVHLDDTGRYQGPTMNRAGRLL